jgi:tetratricopeptide (TPR) repeat protein
MTLRDLRGVALSTDREASLQAYDRAALLLAGYYADPLATIQGALDEDPDFVSGHCLRAAVGVLSAERAAEPLIAESVAAGVRLASRANERERRHFAAAEAWLDGDFHRAVALYGDIVLEHPRDLVALQVAHVGDFYLGQQRLLRDRVVHALPSWNDAVPGYGFVLGMLAFGLEETNLFDHAEEIGRRALAQNPKDPWAVHAVAHVFEMNGQTDAGIDWLESRIDDWAPDNGLAYHNFWHLALFRLENEEPERALALFDERIWPKRSSVALEMVDAASLLFRLHLRGVNVGGRITSVADAWSDPGYRGYYAFNDVHATMALVADGRLTEAREVVRELERRAGADDSNASMTRDVGLPLARALVMFGEERYAEVVTALVPLRQIAHRFGGSNAQRDVIDQTLGVAALRSGQGMIARALAAERRLLRPKSPWARALAASAP